MIRIKAMYFEYKNDSMRITNESVQHELEFCGPTVEDAWSCYRFFCDNHDLAKNSSIKIIGIEEFGKQDIRYFVRRPDFPNILGVFGTETEAIRYAEECEREDEENGYHYDGEPFYEVVRNVDQVVVRKGIC